MNILALDLSLTGTGVAYCDGSTDVWAPKLEGERRLWWFRSAVASLLDGPAVDLVVIEEYAFSRAGAHSHQIGELGGVVRLALYDADQVWVPVLPSVLKKYATGKGNAGKSEMTAAAIRRLDYDGHDDNEADALWLRQMALHHYGKSTVVMPSVNCEALTKVPWPTLDSEAA